MLPATSGVIPRANMLDRVRGSHPVFKHPSKAGIVVIPHPKKDLGKGLVAAIRQQAGL